MIALSKNMSACFAALAALLLSSCGASQVHPRIKVGLLPDDDHVTMVSAGDFNTITMRNVANIARERAPSDTSQQKVFCISPSPDWATALATARQFSASGGAGSTGPSGSLSASATSAETLTQMAGRTAGVMALRDGLYQACVAYANRQIGRAAYALILSQYGNLLGSLVGTASASSGGSGAAASSAAPATSGPVSVSMSVAQPSGAATGGGSSATSASSSAQPPLQLEVMQEAHLQALIVACLNAYDPTLPNSSRDPAANGSTGQEDPILKAALCQKMVNAVANEAQDLVTPAWKTVPTDPTCPSAKAIALADYSTIQKSLARAGLYKGTITGIVDDETKASLKAFQTVNNLCPSGVYDQQTRALLAPPLARKPKALHIWSRARA